jgi:hypothetical protein
MENNARLDKDGFHLHGTDMDWTFGSDGTITITGKTDEGKEKVSELAKKLEKDVKLFLEYLENSKPPKEYL